MIPRPATRDRRIADACRVGKTLVLTIRREMQLVSETSTDPDAPRVGKDGKARQAEGVDHRDKRLEVSRNPEELPNYAKAAGDDARARGLYRGLRALRNALKLMEE